MDQNQDLLRRLLEAERTAREAIEERNAAREERDAEKAARKVAEAELDAEKVARKAAEAKILATRYEIFMKERIALQKCKRPCRFTEYTCIPLQEY